jgi:hypothetical protein
VSDAARTDAATFAVYDAPTKHNVPKAFADYRTKAGLGTIGYALCEPFYATVKVAGAQEPVMVQVFERRVLTYTASNPAAFRVEMGKIGAHYYQWRYGGTIRQGATCQRRPRRRAPPHRPRRLRRPRFPFQATSKAARTSPRRRRWRTCSSTRPT